MHVMPSNFPLALTDTHSMLELQVPLRSNPEIARKVPFHRPTDPSQEVLRSISTFPPDLIPALPE